MPSHLMSSDFATTGIFISGNKGFKAGITITLVSIIFFHTFSQ